jgi:hypothetical protein
MPENYIREDAPADDTGEGDLKPHFIVSVGDAMLLHAQAVAQSILARYKALTGKDLPPPDPPT